MKKITVESIRDYRIPQQVAISPDGAKLAVTVQTCNVEEDRYNYNIYLQEGDAFRPVTGLGKESSFIWDDNDTLLFPALRDDTDKKKAADEEFTVFYRLNLKGGEAQKAFKVPVHATKTEKISEGVYLITAYCDATVPDYWKMTAEEKKAVADDRKKNKDFNVLDEHPYWANGLPGFQNKMRNRLFLYEEKTDTLTPASSPLFQVMGSVTVGTKVYYLGSEYTAADPDFRDVACFDLETKEFKVISQNSTLDSRTQWIGSYDGKVVLMASSAAVYGGCAHPDFWEVNTETGELKLIAEADYSIKEILNRGDHFLMVTPQRYGHQIYRVDADGFTALTDYRGMITNTDARNGRMVFSGISGTAINEVYEVKDGKTVRISHFNDDLDYYVAESEPMTIMSRGLEIDGYICKPFDYDPSKKYPAILYIHGGPKGVFYEGFQPMIQLWASQGYFVYYCNPQGSDGRGNDFAEIRGMMGGPDYEDIMNWTDAVLEKYPQIDSERMGVTGISYGGYMTNWIIGHTSRFKAASSQCSVANWTSMYGVSDISRKYVRELMLGSPFEKPVEYWDRSPLKYACYCKTPTLFIQPLSDYRCHLAEGLQMVTTLMDFGCETRAVTFEGDSHGMNSIGKPSHRERSYTETLNWMNSHLDNE